MVVSKTTKYVFRKPKSLNNLIEAFQKFYLLQKEYCISQSYEIKNPID